MRRTGVAALAGLLLLGAPAAAQTTDTVFVELRADAAQVRQRLVPEDGAVQAFAIRLDEQTLALTAVTSGGEPLPGAEALIPVDGAWRLDVPAAAPVVVTYTVRGADGGWLDRIPLFVAGGEAEQTVVQEITVPWLIRMEGDPAVLAELDLSTSLPRFTRAGEGAVTATLSSVPGLLRLSRGGALSFVRVADLVVLALLLTGAAWTWRNARVRREAGGAGG